MVDRRTPAPGPDRESLSRPERNLLCPNCQMEMRSGVCPYCAEHPHTHMKPDDTPLDARRAAIRAQRDRIGEATTYTDRELAEMHELAKRRAAAFRNALGQDEAGDREEEQVPGQNSSE